MREIAQPPPNSTLALTTNDTLVAFYGSSFCQPLKILTYSVTENKWSKLSLDLHDALPPNYMENSVYISSPSRSSIYIYGGRNLTSSCEIFPLDYDFSNSFKNLEVLSIIENQTHVSNNIVEFDFINQSFKKVSTDFETTEIFGAGIFHKSNSSSLIIGGKTSRGWIGTNQLSIWEYSSWVFTSVNNYEKVDSRTNPLILPLLTPLNSSSYWDVNFELSKQVESFLVIGGSVNGHDALPFVTSLSFNSSTGWIWNSPATQKMFNQSTILGAVTFGDILIAFFPEDNSKSLRRNGDGLNVQYINIHSWEKIENYSPLDLQIQSLKEISPSVESGNPVNLKDSNTSINSSSSSSTTLNEPSPTETFETAENEDASGKSTKIALSVALPLSLIFSVALFAILYRRCATKWITQGEKWGNRLQTPASQYFGPLIPPEPLQSTGSVKYPDFYRSESINSWTEKKLFYEMNISQEQGQSKPLGTSIHQEPYQLVKSVPKAVRSPKNVKSSPYVGGFVCDDGSIPIEEELQEINFIRPYEPKSLSTPNFSNFQGPNKSQGFVLQGMSALFKNFGSKERKSYQCLENCENGTGSPTLLKTEGNQASRSNGSPYPNSTQDYRQLFQVDGLEYGRGPRFEHAGVHTIETAEKPDQVDGDYNDDSDTLEDIFRGREVQILVSSRRRGQLRVTNPDPATSRTNSLRPAAGISAVTEESEERMGQEQDQIMEKLEVRKKRVGVSEKNGVNEEEILKQIKEQKRYNSDDSDGTRAVSSGSTFGQLRKGKGKTFTNINGLK